MSYAPFKMIQTRSVIAVLYELDNSFRQIYIDGRPLPKDPQPTWGGYSVGWWDGDTLVVDAAAKPGSGDRFVLDAISRVTAPVILALTKVDLVAKAGVKIEAGK